MMIDFAYSRTCRQQTIRRYFGEEEPARCGNCDVCRQSAGSSRAPTEAEALIVRKLLSGVARMSARASDGWEPRFGRGRIVQTLVGSRSREIIASGLDQLSTHGILKSEGVAFLNEVLRELQETGMLSSSHGQYPMVTLTQRGEEVMKGASDYELRWPVRTGGARVERSGGLQVKSNAGANVEPEDEALLKRLKKVRLELARQNGNLPAYVVFADETLRAFARFKPGSVEAGRKIRGVGEVKAQRYLPAFIEAITNAGAP
jgi:ATP-dependent DNA helicase RecQ